jgi:precorrin-6A/cobalt-precorrin-6A reductase
VIFFMAGTSDARELALMLQAHGYPLVASVVTESAGTSLRESGIDVRIGRLDQEAMTQALANYEAILLVDASHPYAQEAHRTAMAAAAARGITYLRFERASQHYADLAGVMLVDSYEQAAEIAAQKQGSIMLTTGGKTLAIFAKRLLGDANIRLVARMLPRRDNMEKCEQLGFEQKNIIAIQGPFTREFNEALYRQFKTTLMITKESGQVGSVDEKVQAALALGIEVVIIRRPPLEYGHSYETFAAVLCAVQAVWEDGTT